MLARARSKIRIDNIENDNSDESNVAHSDADLRTSILRLIPLGSDVENTAREFKRRKFSGSRSLRQSRTTNSSSLENSLRDESVHNDNSRRSGLRSSMRQSLTMSQLLDISSDDDAAPLNSSGVRRGGATLRASMRQSITNSNHDSLKDDGAPLKSRRSGSAKRFSMRQSITNSNLKDSDADNLKTSNLRKSVIFDDNLPSLNQSDRSDDEVLRKSKTNIDSEARAKEGEKESSKKVPERVQRKPRKFSQSVTAKDTMTWGISEEKKEEPVRQKDDFYKPQRMRRSCNEGSFSRSTTRGSTENLAGSDINMGRLKSSGNHGSSDNLRSMAKRDERRSLTQSMSGAKINRSSITRRESDGNTASLKRSTGARGSNSNLRGSTRRAPVANGLRDSTTLRRSADGSNMDDSNLRLNLRGSLRRSTSEVNLRGSLRRSTNEANLRYGLDSSRSDSTRANEQQRRPGPRRREIV